MPVSEETSEKIFSLPMYPYLEWEEQKKVVELVKGYKNLEADRKVRLSLTKRFSNDG
ncbi:hypothetical protein ACFL5V_10440 [Fibrobacterota bacterium]